MDMPAKSSRPSEGQRALADAIVKARADGMRHVLYKPFRADQVIPAALDGPPTPIR